MAEGGDDVLHLVGAAGGTGGNSDCSQEAGAGPHGGDGARCRLRTWARPTRRGPARTPLPPPPVKMEATAGPRSRRPPVGRAGPGPQGPGLRARRPRGEEGRGAEGCAGARPAGRGRASYYREATWAAGLGFCSPSTPTSRARVTGCVGPEVPRRRRAGRPPWRRSVGLQPALLGRKWKATVDLISHTAC
uniref:Uncharacterized protein n=1 Tax=Rangifer tarandus platyrhynchus TaxID=3082113 RepID=A0ACB0FK00_RANTA|nr:unnamed protein product [Rangifer tarandus platyrhynchus]